MCLKKLCIFIYNLEIFEPWSSLILEMELEHLVFNLLNLLQSQTLRSFEMDCGVQDLDVFDLNFMLHKIVSVIHISWYEV